MMKQQYTLNVISDASSITLTVIGKAYREDGTALVPRQVLRETYVGEGRAEEAKARARELAATVMVNQLQHDERRRQDRPRP